MSHIKDIRHIQLTYDKVSQLAPTERATDIEDTPYSYLSPMGMQFAIAITAAAIPWILVCSFANIIKRKWEVTYHKNHKNNQLIAHSDF